LRLTAADCCSPNYASPFAPADPTVQNQTAQIIYQYAASTLWLTYGLAVGVSAACVLVGTAVVLGQHAAYSSKFSTTLRVATGAYLDGYIAPEDQGGQDPLARYLENMYVQFPLDGAVMPAESGYQEEMVGGNEGGGDATELMKQHVL
jgi:hypothetical protein